MHACMWYRRAKIICGCPVFHFHFFFCMKQHPFREYIIMVMMPMEQLERVSSQNRETRQIAGNERVRDKEPIKMLLSIREKILSR